MSVSRVPSIRALLRRRLICVVALCLMLPLLAALPARPSRADAGPVSSCGPNSTSSHNGLCTITTTSITALRIDQPFVAGPSYEYKTITFQPGDRITINAGGCVQTQGIGKTWKRYVDPSGSDSGPPDGQYFGRATIPGAYFDDNPVQKVQGTPLVNMINRPMTIPAINGPTDFTQALDLTLGYQDDNYGDNGYYDHDDGDNDQCKQDSVNPDGGPAWVTVSVQHGVPGPMPALHPMPFDVVPQGSYDSNFLFKNPVWGWQYNHGSMGTDSVYESHCDPDVNCTSQATTVDHIGWDLWEPVFQLCGGSPPKGHRNWFDVTYTGQINWDSFDGGGFLGLGDVKGDDDYNMNLTTPDYQGTGPAGTTQGNPQSIHMEFDSDETIDHFDNSPWWANLHAAVDNGDQGTIDAMVKSHDAVTIGLMGLDAVHPPAGTEIHPVHALAIREAQPGNVDPGRDSWAIFARNWGNEGECGSQQHFLDSDHVTLDLPRPANAKPNATATLTEPSNFYAHNTTSQPVVHNDAAGVQITFDLGNAADKPFEVGELHLNWGTIAPAARRPGARKASTATARHPAASVRPADSGDPEDLLAQVWSAMTPAQQQTANAYFDQLRPPNPVTPVTPVTAQPSSTAPAFPTGVPTVSTVPDTTAMLRLKAQFQSLCSATGGSLPTQPDWCNGADLPPLTTLTTGGGAAGPDGWVTTPVTATLTAHDANGSGIDHTEYSYDGQNWTTYTGPFTLPDGTYTIYYRSKDKKGNLEDTRQRAFKIDTKPPAITVTSPTATSYTHSSTLTLGYSADDGPTSGLGAGSGVASVVAKLDGSTTLAGHGLANGQTINLLTELAPGQHTFTVDATDNVGHTSSSAVTFSVVVTPESIEQDVRQFYASGDIKSKAVELTLLSELGLAEISWNLGLCLTADPAYGTFITEVTTLGGTAITSAAAQIMIGDAKNLIAQCPILPKAHR